ncbi:MAG: 4Fe-4S binding protein [Lachnospiraceae bacterium]|nr:4Fe-4S binding protein [Lachnospiraceae bacterium]
MYKITDACVSCGTCAEGCPAGAIAEGEQHYEINTDVCLECGACESSCPTGAIVEE